MAAIAAAGEAARRAALRPQRLSIRLEAHVRVLGAEDPLTVGCVELLLEAYEGNGDTEQVAKWFGRLPG